MNSESVEYSNDIYSNPHSSKVKFMTDEHCRYVDRAKARVSLSTFLFNCEPKLMQQISIQTAVIVSMWHISIGVASSTSQKIVQNILLANA